MAGSEAVMRLPGRGSRAGVKGGASVPGAAKGLAGAARRPPWVVGGDMGGGWASRTLAGSAGDVLARQQNPHQGDLPVGTGGFAACSSSYLSIT